MPSGPNTARVLMELGYQVDCSKLPYTNLRGDGGPDFRGTPSDPHWLPEGLLEIPLTVGFLGVAASAGPKVEALFDSPSAARLRIPGLLARSGLVARSKLTPEGVPAKEQCRLIEALVRRGQRVFTLAYHSPSLEPGNTPYVRDEMELRAFLASIAQVLAFFRDRIGGRFTTPAKLYRELSEARVAA